MQITTENATQLCYLPAAEVRGPAGYMVGLELRGLDNERLGRLVEQVLVEAVDVVKRRRPDGSAETLGRADLGLAQMPMGFRRAALLRPDWASLCLAPSFQ